MRYTSCVRIHYFTLRYITLYYNVLLYYIIRGGCFGTPVKDPAWSARGSNLRPIRDARQKSDSPPIQNVHKTSPCAWALVCANFEFILPLRMGRKPAHRMAQSGHRLCAFRTGYLLAPRIGHPYIIIYIIIYYITHTAEVRRPRFSESTASNSEPAPPP